jgi:hypothetical protein
MDAVGRIGGVVVPAIGVGLWCASVVVSVFFYVYFSVSFALCCAFSF